MYTILISTLLLNIIQWKLDFTFWLVHGLFTYHVPNTSHKVIILLFNWDFRRAWARKMHSLIVSEEVASDLLGAELLIKRHKEYKLDIDKQGLKYEDLEQTGNNLVKEGHFMCMEVSYWLKKSINWNSNYSMLWSFRYTHNMVNLFASCYFIFLHFHHCCEMPGTTRECTLNALNELKQGMHLLALKHLNEWTMNCLLATKCLHQ